MYYFGWNMTRKPENIKYLFAKTETMYMKEELSISLGQTGEIKLYGTLELDQFKRAIIQRVNIEETRANWKKTSPININKQKIMELGDELSLLSQRDLQQKIGGKEELLRAAKNQLLNDGYLEKKSRKGPNGGTISVLAYTEKVWSPDLEDC